MVTFVVAPYRPEERESISPALSRTASDLRIDPDEYRALLLERWPRIRFRASEYILLGWFLPLSEEGGGINGGLEHDQQTVGSDTPFEDFFLWHRSVIPAKFRLFLSHEGSWDTLELKVDTSLEEIQDFCGGRV